MKLYLFGVLAALACMTAVWKIAEGEIRPMADSIELPKPALKGKVSVEEAIKARRSRRSFSADPLTVKEISQILWAAQGITEPRRGLRAAPSAGATFPMEILIALGPNSVTGLSAGTYRYVPAGNTLIRIGDKDIRSAVANAALGQQFLAQAPVTVLIAADYRRTTRRYVKRGQRYVHMEAGHISENIYLQAEALKLGTVAVGAFDDKETAKVFDLQERSPCASCRSAAPGSVLLPPPSA